MADAIFVVNKDGYIGEAVRKEIDYAKKQNKEIIYLVITTSTENENVNKNIE